MKKKTVKKEQIKIRNILEIGMINLEYKCTKMGNSARRQLIDNPTGSPKFTSSF